MGKHMGVWGFVCVSIAGAAFAATQGGKALEADQKYDAGFAKVELVGVCKTTEEEASCWDPQGKPHTELTEEFKAAFTANDYRNVPVSYGQKSRVAVFRITNPPYNDPRGNIDSSLQTSNSRGHFDWPNRNSSSSEEPRTEYRAVVITGKLTDKVGKAWTHFRKTAPPSDRFAPKVGENVNYLGTKYTVRKIVSSQLDPTVYMMEGSKRWLIAMTAENTPEGMRPQVGWVAIDSEGLSIRAVDKDGNPVYVDPNQLNNFNMVPGRPTVAAPKFFPARLMPQNYGQPGLGDDYPLYSNINPAKIRAIYAYGSTADRITLNGIPLDPSP